MKKTVFALATVTMLTLAGCVAIDADEHSVDAVAINTETALRVCGGEGMVKEVTDDGFTCKEAGK